MLSRLVTPISMGSLCRISSRLPQVTYKAAASSAVATPNVSAVDSGERDLVNFPRPVQGLYGGKVRMGFLPEEWFTFFYRKTGVTGPYLFGTGLIMFLCSKEIYVMDHDFYVGVPLVLLAFLAIKNFGDKTAEVLDDAGEKYLDQFRIPTIQKKKVLVDNIEGEKKVQWSIDAQKHIFDAKRENVLLQQEAEYRKRLMHTYQEVKKLLDYHVQTLNTVRQVQHKHMVNWIVDNVLRSITPQQEEEALKKCIADLKSISASY